MYENSYAYIPQWLNVQCIDALLKIKMFVQKKGPQSKVCCFVVTRVSSIEGWWVADSAVRWEHIQFHTKKMSEILGRGGESNRWLETLWVNSSSYGKSSPGLHHSILQLGGNWALGKWWNARPLFTRDPRRQFLPPPPQKKHSLLPTKVASINF